MGAGPLDASRMTRSPSVLFGRPSSGAGGSMHGLAAPAAVTHPIPPLISRELR